MIFSIALVYFFFKLSLLFIDFFNLSSIMFLLINFLVFFDTESYLSFFDLIILFGGITVISIISCWLNIQRSHFVPEVKSVESLSFDMTSNFCLLTNKFMQIMQKKRENRKIYLKQVFPIKFT